MTIVYVVNSIELVKKKSGVVTAKSNVNGVYTDPSDAYRTACELIEKHLKRNKYYAPDGPSPKNAQESKKSKESKESSEPELEKPATEYDKRQAAVSKRMSKKEPWAAIYYKMDNFISEWAPTIAELNMKILDVRVNDTDLN